MKIEITARNCEANAHLKKITESKLSKLDKYFGGTDTEAKVCFKKEGLSKTVEINVIFAGKPVRASVSDKNFYNGLDKVLPKIEGQIRKYRTRFDKDRKNSAFFDGAVYKNKSPETSNNVVKEKKFVLKPMTVNEAVEEMELLGHAFYVFKEIKTNSVQILYRRNDGDLGLIEPQD